MNNTPDQKNDLKQCSFGFRIWIFFLFIVINTAVTIFMIVSKIIIIALWPFVRLSFFLEYLNLKLQKFILEENLKNYPDVEGDSSCFNNSEYK